MNQNNFANIFIILCYEMVLESVDSAQLISVSNYARPLFNRLTASRGTQRIPSHLIEEDPRLRERVCEDISTSEIFRIFGMVPIDARKIYDNRHQEKYNKVYRLIYNKRHYQYVNPYREWRIQSVSSGSIIDENVFICPFEDTISHSLRYYYVTNEYHVGAIEELYKPGRFLFGKPVSADSRVVHSLLAEEPALAYSVTEPDEFNVELHYLRLHEYVEPAFSNSMDPLCKLIGGGFDNDQHFRFCVAVLKSSYFNNARYPSAPIPSENQCKTKYVSFKTNEGIEKANGRTFYERMVLCRSAYLDSQESMFLFISRGYISNQVFVYLLNNDGNIYLENLSTNIAIRDELNSFDLPEA